jgi:hypothetical protein
MDSKVDFSPGVKLFKGGALVRREYSGLDTVLGQEIDQVADHVLGSPIDVAGKAE